MINRFEEFTANIALAYKYINKIKTYAMKEFGLKASHVMCLFYIGKNNDGLTAVELCELCHEDKAGISKNLNSLRLRGLINSDLPNVGKKYRAKYFVTEKGKGIYNKISDFIVKTVDRCGLSCEDGEISNFYKTLGSIVSNLENFYGELCKDE